MKFNIPNHVYEILGWFGVVFVVGSYCLLALGILNGNNWPYHALVLVGSVFVTAISLQRRAMQPAVLNACFAALALVALIRIALL